MKYNTVVIEFDSQGKWYVKHRVDNRERRYTQTAPSKLGFYHYPVTMSKTEAFEALRGVLVNEAQTRIAALQQMVQELEKLTDSEENS